MKVDDQSAACVEKNGDRASDEELQDQRNIWVQVIFQDPAISEKTQCGEREQINHAP